MKTEDIVFAIYLGFGVITLATCAYLRYKRKKTSILWVPFSHDLFMLVYLVAWPIFLPLLLVVVFSKGDAETEDERKWKRFEDD